MKIFKNKFYFALIIFILLISSISVSHAKKESQKSIIISGAWAIYPSAMAWAKEYQKINPQIKIEVSGGGSGKGATDVIAGVVDIGMISREPYPSELKKGIYPINILHDAVFPVINSRNPYVSEILKRGFTHKQFKDIFLKDTASTWEAYGGKLKNISLYTRSDPCAAAVLWSKFLGKKQTDLRGIGIYSDPGMLTAIKKDIYSLGYSNYSYVFNKKGKIKRHTYSPY
ncbi:MAG: substrate-binding domain-containing protein [Candidatus Margulisbacteria bacterium]|nr:substrate-binding domain-containing protein [Candidatus Margulisiibacteriota bacterium]